MFTSKWLHTITSKGKNLQHFFEFFFLHTAGEPLHLEIFQKMLILAFLKIALFFEFFAHGIGNTVE